MSNQDFAILVGIARYKDNNTYADLNGPPNDVKRIEHWLQDVNGGNVPSANICRLLTPPVLMRPPLGGAPGNGKPWIPNRERFTAAFNQIALDPTTGQYKRHDGRLYLYFSGHGFSQSVDMTARAALFAADAFGISRPNIPGTVYAEAAKRVALFREIILIMDCCRDVQRNSHYGAYELDQTESTLSEKVRLFAIYASAKSGKAQEREFPSENGNVFGLLTHALVRSLDEAPTDVAGRVSGTALNNYMKVHWPDWYPVGMSPPPPRTIYSDAGEVFFNSRKALKKQKFTFTTPVPAPIQVRLQSDVLDATGSLADDEVIWRGPNDAWTVVIPFDPDAPPGRKSFTLKLPAITHTLKVLSPLEVVRDFTAGEANAVEL